MLQLGQKAAIYCRVSTADQSCERQERDLRAFAERAGYRAIGVFKETGSGAKLDRIERRKVMALAQARRIDAVLVTELSRWGRSTGSVRVTAGRLRMAQHGQTQAVIRPRERATRPTRRLAFVCKLGE